MEILAKWASIALLASLIACGSLDTKSVTQINPETVYKKDMSVTFNGQEYVGLAVLPKQAAYDLHITAAGDLDLFTFTNCHREEVSENAGNVSTVKRSFIFKKIVSSKNQINMTFTPTAMETNPACPVFLAGYEKDQGRHSWAFIDFEHEANGLGAIVSCNGSERSYNGVSVCQSKIGLFQKITFKERVRVSPDKGCELPTTSGTDFDFPLKKGQCLYVFITDGGKVHKLTAFGYEQILIRK